MAITRNRSKKVAILSGEGDPAAAADLGNKGAGLAELVSLGIPVPPFFTVTTSVARAFAQHQRLPKRLQWQLDWGIKALERETGKVFGGAENPLLVSVRSGAAVSMPGMMDTVLNLGMNVEITRTLSRTTSGRFAWDCYRRFLAMFGEIVLGIPSERFTEIYETAKRADFFDVLTVHGLENVCGEFRDVIETDHPVTDDPRQQLEQALIAVLGSWNNPRAVAYRQAQGISNDLGTAVNIQSMVFGNRDINSCTGVAFSCNVATGEPGLWGEFLVGAQGEDVVNGTVTPLPIAKMPAWNLPVYRQLDAIVQKLASHRDQEVEVEFTVESGNLYILQVRAAKLHPEAAITVATRRVWNKKATRDEALKMVTAEQVQTIQALGFEPAALERALKTNLLARGLPASPGAAVGTVVTSSQAAVEAASKGQKVILVRPDTSPDDLPGMLAAVAIVTENGGETCHAAVVARGLGKPAVVGCKKPAAGVWMVAAGQTISVDGKTGMVMLGEVARAPASVKKEVSIFLRWWRAEEAKNWRKPVLRFEAFEETVSINRLLNDFYLSDAMARNAEETSLASECTLLKHHVHTNAAERIAMYLVVAIGGEVRHAKRDKGWESCHPELDSLISEFGVELDNDPYPARAQRAAVVQLNSMTPAQHVRFVDLVAAVFEKGPWRSAYGGKKWAAIARAAHGFLTGKLSHSVFADHAFDLQHNGGCVFGKHDMLSGDRDLVRRQLDRKKQASGVLDLYTKLAHSSYERTLDASPQVEQLYRKGEKLGIWGGQEGDKQTKPVSGTGRRVGFGGSPVSWGSSKKTSGW